MKNCSFCENSKKHLGMGVGRAVGVMVGGSGLGGGGVQGGCEQRNKVIVKINFFLQKSGLGIEGGGASGGPDWGGGGVRVDVMKN